MVSTAFRRSSALFGAGPLLLCFLVRPVLHPSAPDEAFQTPKSAARWYLETSPFPKPRVPRNNLSSSRAVSEGWQRPSHPTPAHALHAAHTHLTMHEARGHSRKGAAYSGMPQCRQTHPEGMMQPRGDGVIRRRPEIGGPRHFVSSAPSQSDALCLLNQIYHDRPKGSALVAWSASTWTPGRPNIPPLSKNWRARLLVASFLGADMAHHDTRSDTCGNFPGDGSGRVLIGASSPSPPPVRPVSRSLPGSHCHCRVRVGSRGMRLRQYLGGIEGSKGG